MAIRRMFSTRLLSSAKFLKMPISSQALYFHLGLHADDDGVVEAFPVIRTVGCTEDDLKVLVAKGFVTVLNDDLVTYITDWTENNNIRADRKIDSIYKDLLLQINPDAQIVERREKRVPEIGASGICQASDGQMPGRCQPDARIGKERLGKDRLGQDRSGERKSTRFTPPTLDEVREYCESRKSSVDPERFVDWYTANGWKVGKNPMKDWKAAVRSWEQRDKAERPAEKTREQLERERNDPYLEPLDW